MTTVSLEGPHHPLCITAAGFTRGKCLPDFCMPRWVPAAFSDRFLKTPLLLALTISNGDEQVIRATIHDPQFFPQKNKDNPL